MSIGTLVANLMGGGSLTGLRGGPSALPSNQGGGQPGQPAPSPGVSNTPSPATQSPQDLGQMYLQLTRQAMAAQGIDRALTGLAAVNSTPAAAQALLGAMPQQQDVGTQLQNLMQIQQYQQQQRALQGMLSPEFIRDMATKTGLSPVEVQALIYSGKIGDVMTNLAGVSGDPSAQAMNRDRRAWEAANVVKDAQGNPVLDANGQPKYSSPEPSKFFNVEQYKAETAGTVAKQQQIAKDIQADQANFAPGKNAYDQMINDTRNLLAMPGLDSILGPGNAAKTSKLAQETGATMLLDDATQNALAKYNQVMAQQYGAGVQDFKGAGRITNQELSTDMPSQSTMGTRGVTPEAFRANAQGYINKLLIKRAQLFGQAGQLNSPDLSDYDYDKLVNDIYKPGGSQYVPGQDPRTTVPDTSIRTPAQARALPYGRAFIIPDGSGRIGYAGVNTGG